jgi:hypothetical protein
MRLRPKIEAPWNTIADALNEAEKLLAEGTEILVVEMKEWLQTVGLAQA